MSVKVVNSANDFGSVESGPVFGEDSLTFEMEIKFTPVDVLGHQAEPVCGRERVT